MQPGKFRMRPGRPCASPAVLPHVDRRSAFAARDWRVIEPPRVAPGRCARGNGWALRSGCGATGQLSLRVPASCVPGFADGMFTGDPMTSYSVARSAQRAIVVATWPGPWSDHSANVTTLSDFGPASHLTSFLTRLSEDALGCRRLPRRLSRAGSRRQRARAAAADPGRQDRGGPLARGRLPSRRPVEFRWRHRTAGGGRAGRVQRCTGPSGSRSPTRLPQTPPSALTPSGS